MKKILLISLFFCCYVPGTFPQSFLSPTYAERANKLLAAFNNDSLKVLQLPFNDRLRTHWERLPGERLGLKLSHFTEAQKIALHELLRSCLSTQGYLTVTAVMFNEDIQQKFEPNLGRNEYWVKFSVLLRLRLTGAGTGRAPSFTQLHLPGKPDDFQQPFFNVYQPC